MSSILRTDVSHYHWSIRVHLKYVHCGCAFALPGHALPMMFLDKAWSFEHYLAECVVSVFFVLLCTQLFQPTLECKN